jgi:shikimate kinase
VSTTPRLVLVGPPGSGKTSVGRPLATKWELSFRDTDDDVEEATGRSIADIFVESGEPVFRDLERTAVFAALAEHRGVLALGGGAVMNADIRSALAINRVVFLDVGLAAAMSRLEMNRSRPLLLGNVRAQWQALADARRPFYTEVADQVVTTDKRDIDDIVDEIADRWKDSDDD